MAQLSSLGRDEKTSCSKLIALAASASSVEFWGMAVAKASCGGLPVVASGFIPYADILDAEVGSAIFLRKNNAWQACSKGCGTMV
jgi:hypothetical protein